MVTRSNKLHKKKGGFPLDVFQSYDVKERYSHGGGAGGSD